MAQNQDHCPRCVGCIQLLLCQRTFNLTSLGKSSATMLVRICSLYTIILITPSSLPYHSCLSEDFFFKIKVNLSWEGSGICNIGIGCILLNCNQKNQLSVPSSPSKLFVCLVEGTSARVNNSTLRVMDCTMETLPAIPLKYRTSLQRNTYSLDYHC